MPQIKTRHTIEGCPQKGYELSYIVIGIPELQSEEIKTATHQQRSIWLFLLTTSEMYGSGDTLDISEWSDRDCLSIIGCDLAELHQTCDLWDIRDDKIHITIYPHDLHDEFTIRSDIERRRRQASRFCNDPENRAFVLDRDSNQCCYCGATTSLSMDHIIPISKGGVDSLDNLQTLCMSCNAKKHNKLEE